MGKFLTKLQDEELDNGKHRLLTPLIYWSSTVGLVIVPTGFVTDFASVPRIPFVYWLFGGLGDREAVVHDFLYSGHHVTGAVHVVDNQVLAVTVTRSIADKVLRGARYSTDRMSLDEYECVTIPALLNNTWAYAAAWCWWVGVTCVGWYHWETGNGGTV